MRFSKFGPLLGLGLCAGVVACGSLADSSKVEPIAKIQGALTASTAVPPGAHVALVWRLGDGSGVVVAQDTEVVGGRFAFELNTPPADNLFFAADSSSSTSDTPVSTGAGAGPDPSTPTAPPPAVDAGAPSAQSARAGLHPLTTVGGEVSSPMSVAIAGFVLYVDANGNGRLDLEGDAASSPDTILGGNAELILAFLRDGTQLSYEKLRDKTGAIPVRGYNLFWTEGRVIPLDAVEIELRSDAKLPGSVCSAGVSTATGGASSGAATTGSGSTPSSGNPEPAPTDAGVPTTNPSYPAPGAPGLQCSADGTSFSYTSCGTTPPPPPAPVGLCTSVSVDVTEPCTGYGVHLPDGPVPSDWPCVVTDVDASAPTPVDAGSN